MKQFDNYKKIYRYIEHIDKSNPQYETHIIISHLYKYLEDYLNVITIQFKRIQQTKKEMEPLANQSIEKFNDRLLFTKLWADIHFLLIAIEKSYNITIKLYNKLSMKIKSKQIKSSDDYIAKKRLRNMLEHMDDNLTDGLNESKRIIPNYSSHNINWFDNQYGFISDNTLKLKKYKFKIEETSLNLLYNYYDEITSILNKDYVLPVKKDADAFWESFEKWRNNNQAQNQ